LVYEVFIILRVARARNPPMIIPDSFNTPLKPKPISSEAWHILIFYNFLKYNEDKKIVV